MPSASVPEKSTSRAGRIISATTRKLTAPVSTFIKGKRASKKSGSSAPSTKATSSTASASSTPGPTRKRRRVVIEDEETDDESSNGDVLPSNGDALMTDATSSASHNSSGTNTSIAIEIESDTSGGGDSDEEAAETDAEEELTRLMGDWTAPIYAFFKPVPEIEYIDGRRCHTFICAALHCRGASKKVRRYLDTKDRKSTSNLRKHARRCWGEEAVAAADEAANADEVRRTTLSTGGVLQSDNLTAMFAREGKGKVTYSHRTHTRTETRAEIVRWVAESMRPASIVKDRGFNSLMKTGRPGYWIPSPSTVARDIKLVFARTRNRVAQILQDHPGTLSFATDAWTATNHRAYVAFTVHLEKDGESFSLLLDFVELPRSHSGFNMAREFAQILEDFGISKKFLAITADNASNNDTMVENLASLVESFPGSPNQVRCFLHVVSLTAKTLIRIFDPPSKSNAESTNDIDAAEAELRALAENIENEDLEAQLDRALDEVAEKSDAGILDDLENSTEGWVDETALLSQEEREELSEKIRPIRLALVKLRKFAYAVIHSSTLLLPRWNELLEQLKLALRIMPRDVSTRWNSTYDMISFAIEYRKAIATMTADVDNNLRKYELSRQEWELVEELARVLKVFKHATLFFSRSTPNLATVIPAMDHVDEILTTQALDDSLSPSIRAACGLARKTLNRYYERTDLSDMYRIAMVLHPKYKLDYFKSQNWSEEWIGTARGIVEDQFEQSYADRPSPTPEYEVPAHSLSTKVRGDENIFDSLPSIATAPSAANSSQSELDRYLSTRADPTVQDALKWWSDRRTMYPRLSRMALDYLSVPATSVDVERVFSRARILLSHLRNRLTGQSTRALMCLNSWSAAGLVKNKDVLSVARLTELDGDEDVELEDGWDRINLGAAPLA